jgi:transposase InsO family protein
MSRKGNCWDNAVAESFFKLLKKECVYRNAYLTKKKPSYLFLIGLKHGITQIEYTAILEINQL